MKANFITQKSHGTGFLKLMGLYLITRPGEQERLLRLGGADGVQEKVLSNYNFKSSLVQENLIN